ncbi:MAG: AI-2E family transporter [Caldilineaceae bacterium]
MMTISLSEFIKRFMLVLLVLLLALGMWVARSSLILGFLAAVIAVGISIPARFLRRKGWRRGWAILMAATAVNVFFILLLLLILPALITDIGLLLSSVPYATSSLLASYEALRESSAFLATNLPSPELFSPAAVATDAPVINPDTLTLFIDQILNASLAIAPHLLGGMNTLAAVALNFAFVLFVSVFFLIDPHSYIKASLYLMPRRHHARAVELWNELYDTLTTWITSQFLSASITVGLVWIILGLLLGMPHSLVVAVFAGVATFIPNIGAFLPLIPIVIFTLADDPAQLVLFVPVYLGIQLLESNVITPSIVKAQLLIPAGAMMIFQLLMTLAFGALGLLLAVPVFAVLIVLVREIYAYDMLDLRTANIVLTSDDAGRLQIISRSQQPAMGPDSPTETAA